MPELMRPVEVAKVLGVTVATLANWRTANRGPRWRRLGSIVRYDKDDVRAWIEANVEVHETRDTREEQTQ